MKIGFTKREKGQGCIEFIVGLALIVILILVIIWAISGLIVLIKNNFVEIQPTPTLIPEATEIPIQPQPSINETQAPSETEDNEINSINETPSLSTEVPPAIDTPSGVPPKSAWVRFLDWLSKLFGK